MKSVKATTLKCLTKFSLFSMKISKNN